MAAASKHVRCHELQLVLLQTHVSDDKKPSIISLPRHSKQAGIISLVLRHHLLGVALAYILEALKDSLHHLVSLLCRFKAASPLSPFGIRRCALESRVLLTQVMSMMFPTLLATRKRGRIVKSFRLWERGARSECPPISMPIGYFG